MLLAEMCYAAASRVAPTGVACRLVGRRQRRCTVRWEPAGCVGDRTPRGCGCTCRSGGPLRKALTCAIFCPSLTGVCKEKPIGFFGLAGLCRDVLSRFWRRSVALDAGLLLRLYLTSRVNR